jgi:DNA-binding HxlR family transcriptional regulator
MTTSTVEEVLRQFEWHGVEFTNDSGRDRMADCPFCGKRGALSVNSKTSQWTCHSGPDRCGRSGNFSSFLHQLWEEMVETTSDERLEELAKIREMPVEALREGGVAWDSRNDRWVVPVKNERGKVHDLKIWVRKGGKKKRVLLMTPGIGHGLWGIEELAAAKPGSGLTVWVCEGEWDAMVLRWLLRATGHSEGHLVVGCPGARLRKKTSVWVDLVRSRADRVVLVGDNDADGERMDAVWAGELAARGRRCEFLVWPDSLPEKFDLRDFVARHRSKDLRALTIYRKLEKLIAPEHPRVRFSSGSGDGGGTAGPPATRDRRADGKRPRFEKVLEEFRRWLRMTPDLEMAVRFAVCAHVTAEWPGDPLWGFLVGAPASGKTDVLVSMADAPRTVFQSSVTRENLLSGFAGPNDPSLIPKLIGNCGVFKDWTEMLDSHPTDQAKAYACLRGFYDGRVDRVFGNGTIRHYEGRCSLIAGVTNMIYQTSHVKSGERWLKFQLPRPPRAERELIIESAILGVTREVEKEKALKTAMCEFLDFKRDPLSPAEALDRRTVRRLGALAELVGVLRQTVEWSHGGMGKDREVAYRDDPEMPTRLAKQLTRLALADCAVRGKTKVDATTWRLLERVGFNTANGFNLDVVEAMMSLGGVDVELNELETASKMHRNTLERRLETMEVLGIISRRKISRHGTPGGLRYRVQVCPSVRKLWKTLAPGESHIDSAIDARRSSDE